jgi:hypothetical protein
MGAIMAAYCFDAYAAECRSRNGQKNDAQLLYILAIVHRPGWSCRTLLHAFMMMLMRDYILLMS